MKTPAERGPIGAWAYEARQDADLSVEEVAERLTRIGQPVTAPTIRGIEAGGKQPSRRLLRAMATVYDRPVPGPQLNEPPAGDTPAGGSLAEAIARLTRELEAMRQEREAWQRGLVTILRAAAEGRVPVDLLDALAPPLPEDARPVSDR